MNKFYFSVLKTFSNHAHQPKIKFIGKRSAIIHNTHIKLVTPVVQMKIISDIPVCLISDSLRPKLSEDESDQINNGGVLKIADWTKIKIKKAKA